MSSISKPTFVVIPGSFHVKAHMEPLLAELSKRGYPGISIQSSGIGVVGATEILLRPEKPIRDKTHELVVSDSKEVVLICCSAGGLRGSLAVRFREVDSSVEGRVWWNYLCGICCSNSD